VRCLGDVRASEDPDARADLVMDAAELAWE
jgi:hypothetical protein